MTPNAQFITDQAGKRTAVVLPIDEYEELLEDLADAAALAARAGEPTVGMDDVVAGLKRDGLIPN